MNPQPKHKTDRSPRYLKWLRTQMCCYKGCGRKDGEYMNIVPAHQSLLGGRGTSVKPPDYFALPLCAEHHAAEHLFGVESFWGNTDRKMLVILHLIKFLKEGEKK